LELKGESSQAGNTASESRIIGTLCQWCGFERLELKSDHVHLMNAQVSMEHAVAHCTACDQFTAFARWGKGVQFAYRALEYKRRFRSSRWVAVYPVQCATCNSPRTEPAEINVTVANPVSERFRYDLYVCADCQATTAISYLGTVRSHRAERDPTYHSLWYLDPEETI
jgi:hypothetical protein